MRELFFHEMRYVQLNFVQFKMPTEHAMLSVENIEKKLAYKPLILPDGIKPSNDPVLLYRPVVYAVSAGRRQ